MDVDKHFRKPVKQCEMRIAWAKIMLMIQMKGSHKLKINLECRINRTDE